jgi:acetyl esterase/lipase
MTYTYKRAGGCEIRADVYTTNTEVRPTLVWVHGGALIMGSRRDIRERQRDLYLRAGYHVVAIDYRLAPETKLPEIVEDVVDACRWVRLNGPQLFQADARRMGVVGHSAGGYLTLMLGFRAAPRPSALISFYGYGDIVGEWYSRPDPFYCQQSMVTVEEARASVGEAALSDAWGRPERERFYLYCRQQGLWPREVVGYDPDTQAEAFEPFCPERNVTDGYPPTLLLHGGNDTDVPYEQSVLMAKALARVGVEHELITIPGGGHGFDGADDEASERAFKRVLAFLKAHV